MIKNINITNEDILKQVKLSLKMSDFVEDIFKKKLILETAKDLNITIDRETIQEQADLFRLEYKLESAEDTFNWLKKNYLSLEDFEEIIYTSAVCIELNKKLFADKIEAHFLANKSNYLGAVMYEILFENEDLAWQTFSAIENKEICFYEAAKKYIKDKELNRKCGYRGVLSKSDLNPEISVKVFSCNAPELLKPIKTSKGVHLILVEEVINNELNFPLRHRILLELLNNWFNQNKSEININSNLT